MMNKQRKMYIYIDTLSRENERLKREIERRDYLERKCNVSLDDFKQEESWQTEMYMCLLEFLKDQDRKWFYFGGQTGSGKTMLCSAVCREFICFGIGSENIQWNDDDMRYAKWKKKIEDYKKAKVLFLDGLFKPVREESGKWSMPSEKEIKITREILEYRKNNQLMTFITSERYLSEMLEADEQIGMLIFAGTKGKHFCDVKREASRNYRIKNILGL